MTTYRNETAKTVTDAVKWASESTNRTLNAYVDMVDRSRAGNYTADQMAKDVAAMTVGVQQDAARVFSTVSAMLTGLTK